MAQLSRYTVAAGADFAATDLTVRSSRHRPARNLAAKQHRDFCERAQQVFHTYGKGSTRSIATLVLNVSHYYKLPFAA